MTCSLLLWKLVKEVGFCISIGEFSLLSYPKDGERLQQGYVGDLEQVT